MSLRVRFFRSDKSREGYLSDALLSGAARHGCRVSTTMLGENYDSAEYDVACLVGVKSRTLYEHHHRAGIHVLYFDKGYSRHKSARAVGGWEYWRVSVDAHHPTAMLGSLAMPDDRWRRLGLEAKPWRRRKHGHVLIAGSSAKYHDFYGLKHPTSWTRKLVGEIREHTDREIVYRPKPSWRDAEPVRGTRFSKLPETIDDVLAECNVMVTHGSNACFEAMIAGVPSVILGDAVARPISSTEIAEIETPRMADDAERMRLLANLAYFQWTLPEMASGECWDFIRERLYAE